MRQKPLLSSRIKPFIYQPSPCSAIEKGYPVFHNRDLQTRQFNTDGSFAVEIGPATWTRTTPKTRLIITLNRPPYTRSIHLLILIRIPLQTLRSIYKRCRLSIPKFHFWTHKTDRLELQSKICSMKQFVRKTGSHWMEGFLHSEQSFFP